MVKQSGSSNYKMAEIDRLLNHVEEYLSLGKDEWERMAGFYSTTRTRGWPERDFESIRRKFKVLYSTRKPTGVSEMPSHIQRAKELKEAIDEKANVVVMDDGVDDNQRPDFCFDVDPDEDQFNGGNAAAAEESGSTIGAAGAVLNSSVAGGVAQPGGRHPPASSRQSCRGEFQGLLASPFVGEGRAAFPDTPRPSPPLCTVPTTQERARKLSSASTIRSSSRSRDDSDLSQYQTFSNRLGGSDLTTFRDTVGAKRAMDGDKELSETSYAKRKRICATKATTALKSKLDGVESSANAMGASVLETLLLLREENERKAEARRAEDEQRRREDAADREARYLAEKAEAEERRSHDKLKMDERARRDKEEARARTQKLVLLIASLTKMG